MEKEQIKDFCLDILLNVGIAILLGYGAYSEWKDGNKFISAITGVVTIIIIWKTIDNYQKFNNKTLQKA
jgi:hypothetical protein